MKWICNPNNCIIIITIQFTEFLTFILFHFHSLYHLVFISFSKYLLNTGFWQYNGKLNICYPIFMSFQSNSAEEYVH